MEEEKPDTLDSSTMDTDDSTEETNFEHVDAEADYDEEQTGNSVDPFELTQEEQEKGQNDDKNDAGEVNNANVESIDLNEESNDGKANSDGKDSSDNTNADLNEGSNDDKTNSGEKDSLDNANVNSSNNINVVSSDNMNVDSLDNINADSFDNMNVDSLDNMNADSSDNINVGPRGDANVDAENTNVEKESEMRADSSDNTTGDTEKEPNKIISTDSEEVANSGEDQVNITEKSGCTVVNIQDMEHHEPCALCNKLSICKYNYIDGGKKKYICRDQCLAVFKTKKEDILVKEPFKKFFIAPIVSPMFRYIRLCRQCATTIAKSEAVISWEAMDFCKEACLYRYQVTISKACAECGNTVAYSQIGKYAVRFGCIVRQFCSGHCLETKKKKIRICSYCQKSIKRTKTTIGNKYFCDETCKGMYENLQNPKRPPYLANPDDVNCFVCKDFKEIKVEFSYHDKSYYFCSLKCFTIFKFIQCCDYTPKKCHTCSKFAFQQYLEKHALYYDNVIHFFCSETCQHIYVITNRRVVPCLWCKVKKYNFDMIQKSNYLESTIYMCSIYCLNQFNASLIAALGSKKKCQNCEKPGVYEMNTGGGTTGAFCSNSCMTSYHWLRAKAPAKRGGRGRKQVIPDKPGPLPVIANVVSLAKTAGNSLTSEPFIKKIVIVKEEEPPKVKNVCTMVCSDKIDRGTEIDLIEKEEKDTQTDFEKKIEVVPIMVPIYVPAPFPMWSAPVPKPIPFPIVIPCPVLIPTTKKTANNILKEVPKDTVKVEDPFEAELLMMAELVAAEKKEEAAVQAEESPNDESVHPDHDDLIALGVPSAAVDLEGALEPTIIRPMLNERKQEEEIPRELQRGNTRGRRRGRAPGRRGRRPANYNPVREPEPEPAPIPQEPVEKPDAHMCLKYTFGVNAWKQWVNSKNIDLERSSCNLPPFKTEILQLTADELNYSLCLFVMEVRKPNGSEYAPDTIYYLCLGIQQYLYENGRIDNIFCDSYYEKFTECLDEICAKFTVLYNDAHYIVTRVEEEHLWESKQLGAHSPHVLLSTLMFFNTKYFNLTNVDEHLQLSFSHIMKHWKRPTQPNSPKIPGSRNVLLRFYPPQSTLDSNSKKKKVYEQEENEDNPLRCPVKLYEFYLLKCPESVKTRNDVFYLLPERSCVPDSPVWYSTAAMPKYDLEKMLHRVKMVKEINVALLTN